MSSETLPLGVGIDLVELRDRGKIRDVHAHRGRCEGRQTINAATTSARSMRDPRGRLLSYGKPDISAAETTRTGREEIECSTVPGQSRRSIICGTVQRGAGINWHGPEI